MDVKPGYKQTEVGVIPEDWELKELGEITSIFVGRDLKEENFSSYQDNVYKYPVYSNTVENEGLFGYYDISEYNGYSVTVVGRGVGLGTAFKRNGGYGAVGRLLVLFPNNDVDANYLTKYINHSVRFFEESSGIPQLTGISLAKYKIPLPSIPEQHAIAAALSDVDALIAALDRLIAKKRDIKQAAMQELLTGKRRLPGFSGEWEIAKFGELTSPRKEKIDPRLGGKPSLCIELEHIAPETGRLIGSTITNEFSSLKSIFYSEDVLFGKLRAYLRKYWIANRRGVCSTEIWVFSPSARIMSEYLLQIVKTNQFIEAASTAYGTHMPRSDWNVVRHHKIPLPLLEEQTALAAVLSDMDTEIAALEARREKTRALKQGMMQELLTGRIRLV